ncbi:MAG: PEGA domain-containing protein [Bacteroidales bacterium]|nr:PEGA domain-containing protein [Bacteroidales bacterium]
MKKSITLKTVAIFLAVTVLLSSCASTTMIQSKPSGAKLYLNGESVGKTPYSHTDTKILGSTTTVRLEKEGYETFNTSFSRNEQADVGAIIGGVFVLVPFLWTMKYKPTHTYEMTPIRNNKINAETIKTSNTKLEKLKELKQLLDEKIITQEEFDIEKNKILKNKKQ